jgi:o-succinylbenzoate synthase
MLHFFSYRIPFKEPFRIAGNAISHREGILLVYKQQNMEAYGEVAPLPGFSQEKLDQVRQVLLLNRSLIQESIEQGSGQETLQLLEQLHSFPSLSFGLDTLLHDIAAKRENKSLVDYLFPDGSHHVQSNATLPIGDETSTLKKAEQLIASGFKTLKIKVGENFLREKNILQALRRHFPSVKIRIDANQAWSKDEAIQHLNTLYPLDIEYCEQPVSHTSIDQLKAVKEAVQVPIAADESVRNKTQAAELSERKAADLLILKPMLLGSFQTIFVTKELADTHHIKTIFTTSFETAIGRAAIAVLAAGLSEKDRAQGVATGRFLKQDVAPESWLDEAIITFPASKGLGISLHWEGLTEF